MTGLYRENVQETTAVEGQINATLEGAVTGAQSFAVAFDASSVERWCAYKMRSALTDADGNPVDNVWEAGVCPIQGNTLKRTNAIFIRSSNANALVDWTPGDKNVWCELVGEQMNRIEEIVFCIIAGTNTLTLTPTFPVEARVANRLFVGKAENTNTGAVTANPSGRGAGAVKLGGNALVGGEIIGGRVVGFFDDGTDLELVQLAAPTDFPGQVAFTGIISPAQITADQSNYGPADAVDATKTWALASGVILNLNGSWMISGLAGGRKGRRMTVSNPTAHTVILPAQHASSTAANRFRFANIIPPGATVEFKHDGTYWCLSGNPDMTRGDAFAPTVTSNTGDPNNDVDVSTGHVLSFDGRQVITIRTALTRQLDAAFGTGNGGLASNLSKANSTLYRIFAVLKSNGEGDVGYDTSDTAANLISAHGIVAYRRIGWALTNGSGNIRRFYYAGYRTYYYYDRQIDVSAQSMTTTVPQTLTVSVPPNCDGLFSFRVLASAAFGAAFYPTYVANPSSGGGYYDLEETGGSFDAALAMTVGVDASRQIKAVINGGGTVTIDTGTRGFVDNLLSA